MSKFYRKLITLFCSVLTIGSVMSPVFAEENEDTDTTETTKIPVIQDATTANLTIRYFDDSEETIPITGEEFTIMKVADIGTDIVDGTNGKYIPLDETLEFVDEDNALEYETRVLDFYKENPKTGYTETGTIGEDGTVKFEEIPVGAYLIRETKTMRYHIRSTPFLASVPETNENSDSWNFDVTVYPKQILAGDLTVTKNTKGKTAEKGTFHIVVDFDSQESYKAQLPDGTDGTVKTGDSITIKGGQKLVIFDLPAGVSYKVTETEENDVWQTTYRNQEGTVVEKTSTNVSIINDSTIADTGVHNDLLYWMFGAGAAVTILLLLFLLSRKEKNFVEDEKEEDSKQEKPEK